MQIQININPRRRTGIHEYVHEGAISRATVRLIRHFAKPAVLRQRQADEIHLPVIDGAVHGFLHVVAAVGPFERGDVDAVEPDGFPAGIKHLVPLRVQTHRIKFGIKRAGLARDQSTPSGSANLDRTTRQGQHQRHRRPFEKIQSLHETKLTSRRSIHKLKLPATPLDEFPGRSRQSRPMSSAPPIGSVPKNPSSRARQSAPRGPSGNHTHRC